MYPPREVDQFSVLRLQSKKIYAFCESKSIPSKQKKKKKKNIFIVEMLLNEWKDIKQKQILTENT